MLRCVFSKACKHGLGHGFPCLFELGLELFLTLLSVFLGFSQGQKGEGERRFVSRVRDSFSTPSHRLLTARLFLVIPPEPWQSRCWAGIQTCGQVSQAQDPQDYNPLSQAKCCLQRCVSSIRGHTCTSEIANERLGLRGCFFALQFLALCLEFGQSSLTSLPKFKTIVASQGFLAARATAYSPV